MKINTDMNKIILQKHSEFQKEDKFYTCNMCGQEINWSYKQDPLSITCNVCAENGKKHVVQKCKTCGKVFTYYLDDRYVKPFSRAICGDCSRRSPQKCEITRPNNELKSIPDRYKIASLDNLNEPFKQWMESLSYVGKCLWGGASYYRNYAIFGLLTKILSTPENKGKAVEVISATKLFNTLFQSMNDNKSSDYQVVIKRLQCVDFLFISDLDAGDDGKMMSRFRQEALMLILQERIDYGRVTYVTMNKPPSAMKGIYGQDVVECLESFDVRMIRESDFVIDSVKK